MSASLGTATVDVHARLSDDFSSNLKSQVASAGGGLQGIGKNLGASILKGFAAAGIGAAIGNTLKEAFNNYAEYEQLVGGIETLFGAGGQSLDEYAKSVGKSTSEASAEFAKLGKAQDIAMQNASNAYKTAGMSANEYMTNVTSIAASLKQSLGGDTVKAAKQADAAIVQMSDNSAKMGTDIQSITNAYQGFAKQNYTMLDNLKLGYGGTKTEMERLLSDAKAISGVDYDLSSYSDIIDAIGVIQEDMGIAGTTAKEAAGTIEGSMASASAAWQNWLTGLGNSESDMGDLTKKLFDSLVVAGQNIIPVLGTIVMSIGEAIVEGIGNFDLMGAAEEKFGELIEFMEGIDLAGAVGDAVEGMKDAFNSIDFGETATNIMDGIGEFLSTIDWAELMSNLVDGMLSSTESIYTAIGQILSAVVQYIFEHKGEILSTVLGILVSVGSTIIQHIPTLIASVLSIGTGILSTVIGFGPQVASAVGGVLNSAMSAMNAAFGGFCAAGRNLVQGIVQGIGDGAGWVISKVQEVCSNALQALKSFFGIASPSKVMREMGGYIGDGLALGIGDSSRHVLGSANKLSSGLYDALNKDYTITAGYGMATASAGYGFYVDGERLATVTASPRDAVDGRLTVFAKRGLDM